jgi:HAD superfamily phosphatase (TIGR01668 family)
MLVHDNKHARGRFRPDFIAESVADIDFGHLAELGIQALLIDLDGTVVHRGQYEVSAELTRALGGQPFDIYIATNRPQSQSLQGLEALLHARGAIHPQGIWAKPSRGYYRHALSVLDLPAQQVAMVGDRHFQDIYGANRVGICSVLVCKLDEPVGVFDRLISGLEARRTRRLRRKHYRLLSPPDDSLRQV